MTKELDWEEINWDEQAGKNQQEYGRLREQRKQQFEQQSQKEEQQREASENAKADEAKKLLDEIGCKGILQSFRDSRIRMGIVKGQGPQFVDTIIFGSIPFTHIQISSGYEYMISLRWPKFYTDYWDLESIDPEDSYSKKRPTTHHPVGIKMESYDLSVGIDFLGKELASKRTAVVRSSLGKAHKLEFGPTSRQDLISYLADFRAYPDRSDVVNDVNLVRSKLDQTSRQTIEGRSEAENYLNQGLNVVYGIDVEPPKVIYL